MSGTTDVIVTAGAVGLGWWLYRHEQERRLAQQLTVADQLARVGANTTKPATPPPKAEPSAPKPPKPATAPGAASTTSKPSSKVAVAPAPSKAPSASASVRARPNGPTQPITRAFDSLFAAYGEAVPVPYLRALAAHESDMHADANDGAAAGLLQVVDIVRVDYNQRHGTHFTRADLLVPLVNVQVAADTIRRIVESYRKNHPNIVNLREDWRNPRFVELATLGWNAGFSERAGVGRVATVLEHAGRADLSVELVAATAASAGASAHLSDPRRVSFAKHVTSTYFDELARDEREHAPPSPLTVAPSAEPAPASHPS